MNKSTLVVLLFLSLSQLGCSTISISDLGARIIPQKSAEKTLPDCPPNMRYAERDLDRPYRPDLRVYRTKEGVICRAF